MTPLYILPFDHRNAFKKALFGEVVNLAPEQLQKIKDAKQTVYQGFKKALDLGVPKENAAILVDDEFGDEILKDAKANGFIICLTIEKSGQDEFTFEHGDDFATYINKYQPTYAKVLVRYNPEGDPASNARQQKTLKILSDFCAANKQKFLFELLVPATASQLSIYGKDYDDVARPGLTVTSINQFRSAGVEPDVWKLEGMNKESDYAAVVTAAQAGGRMDVGVVVLGRGDNEEHVKHWLEVGSKVAGVIGFAVGRTVFLDAVKKYSTGEITADLAIDTIANKYFYLYNVFKSK